MVCLDGSKSSVRALRTAILFARQSENTTIVGVHSNISKGSSRLFSNPKIKEENWSKRTKEIMQFAKEKCRIRNVEFEGIVIAGHNAGIDLERFANNKKNKIDHVVIGTQGSGFSKDGFLGVFLTLFYIKQKCQLLL